MLRSSLGFHTITLSLPLFDNNEAHQLITDFCTYREKAGNIEIYRINEKNQPVIYYHSDHLPLKTNIKFKDKDRGIRWCIRESKGFFNFFDYMVEATINPKILSDIIDYLTAATYNDIDLAAANFNEISPLLHSFSIII